MPWALIFWAAFFVVIFGLFLINRDRIRKTLKDTQFIERLLNQPVADTTLEPLLPLPGEDVSAAAEDTPRQRPVDPPPVVPKQEPAKPAAPEAPAAPAPKTETAPSATPPVQPQPAKPPAAQPQPPKPPAAQPALRDRTLYFTQIDSDGAILRVKTIRSLAVSDSPMVDALGALISGPDAREKRQGMVSLIPQGTRILNATVRGSTAYISFSEEFQYNTYGVEGYAAALKQLVWTATEFSNVRDVQILIEGRRVDYLGEGIWIGSPVSREMLN